MLRKKKETVLKEKTDNSRQGKGPINGITDKGTGKVGKRKPVEKNNEKSLEKIEDKDDEFDVKDLIEKDHEITTVSKRIYEESKKIKKINLHHKLIKDELEKKKLTYQVEQKNKNSIDYYKKITVKLQNNINNMEEYINNITNDINILKMAIDEERNERIIHNNNMKIMINEYNTIKKNIATLHEQEKQQHLLNEKLTVELNDLVKEKDTMEKKYRADFKALQQKLKEQKILSTDQKVKETGKIKNNVKEQKKGKGIIEKTTNVGILTNTEEEMKNKLDKFDETFINENIIGNYEDETKIKLRNKIEFLKKLCLKILCINEYQKQNIKKLEENIENMNNAINSIDLLSTKQCDFDNIIMNLNASKEKNYSLISRINLLNYEANVVTKKNKKMKERFNNLNVETYEIVNLKKEITKNMNEKMNQMKKSLSTNEENYKMKKKCFDVCVSELKCVYEFIKKYENHNDKLNLRNQIIQREKHFHFNYIHRYNDQMILEANHLNDFLIFIEKYIYALQCYLPGHSFNYEHYKLENENFDPTFDESLEFYNKNRLSLEERNHLLISEEEEEENRNIMDETNKEGIETKEETKGEIKEEQTEENKQTPEEAQADISGEKIEAKEINVIEKEIEDVEENIEETKEHLEESTNENIEKTENENIDEEIKETKEENTEETKEEIDEIEETKEEIEETKEEIKETKEEIKETKEEIKETKEANTEETKEEIEETKEEIKETKEENTEETKEEIEETEEENTEEIKENIEETKETKEEIEETKEIKEEIKKTKEENVEETKENTEEVKEGKEEQLEETNEENIEAKEMKEEEQLETNEGNVEEMKETEQEQELNTKEEKTDEVNEIEEEEEEEEEEKREEIEETTTEINGIAAEADQIDEMVENNEGEEINVEEEEIPEEIIEEINIPDMQDLIENTEVIIDAKSENESEYEKEKENNMLNHIKSRKIDYNELNEEAPEEILKKTSISSKQL